jgi:hypothetical protein
MGKMTRAPFPKAERAKEPLAIIHSDICGEMSTPTKDQKVYFITFIDDYSRYGYVYLLKHKPEAFDAFKIFKTEVENQLNKTIKVLRTSRVGEYTSGILNDFYRKHGIIHQYTMLYTLQQNGVAERRNRTLMDMVRSMMAYSDIPLSFWGEALHTVVYLLNHSLSKVVTVSPYELWTGRKPSLHHLAIWGCNVHIRVPNQCRTKLQPKSTPGIFIGYSTESKGYHFYDTENDKLVESRDAIFWINTHLAVLNEQGWNYWQTQMSHKWTHLELPQIMRETQIKLPVLQCLGEVGGIHMHLHILMTIMFF